GSEIVHRVAVERDIDGVAIGVRGVDRADPAFLRKPLDIADDVGPMRAAIVGDLNVAIVRAGPQGFRIELAFGERDDGAVKLGGGVIGRDGAAAELFLLFVVGGEIAADLRPGIAAVGGFEDDVCAVIDDVWIEFRHQDRRVPIEAVFQHVIAGARGGDGVGLNVAFLMRAPIEARHIALADVIDDIGVAGIGDDEGAVGVAAHAAPIAGAGAGVVPAVARAAPHFVILKAAEDVIGIGHVEPDVIGLGHGHVVVKIPGGTAVVR